MSSITSKAIVSKVQIGIIEVEGLMLPDGSFAIAVPQIADLFGTTKNTTSRDLKRLLGEGFRPSKTKTELGKQLINVVSLPDFEKIVFKLVVAGNKKAIEFGELLFGLSLHQLFCDSFGVKFEQEHRQEWLKQRMIHKKQFHPYLTIWLKNDGCENYGQAVNIFKTCAKLPIKPVEQYNDEELRLLNNAEVSYNVLRKTGMTHKEALKYI